MRPFGRCYPDALATIIRKRKQRRIDAKAAKALAIHRQVQDVELAKSMNITVDELNQGRKK